MTKRAKLIRFVSALVAIFGIIAQLWVLYQALVDRSMPKTEFAFVVSVSILSILGLFCLLIYLACGCRRQERPFLLAFFSFCAITSFLAILFSDHQEIQELALHTTLFAAAIVFIVSRGLGFAKSLIISLVPFIINLFWFGFCIVVVPQGQLNIYSVIWPLVIFLILSQCFVPQLLNMKANILLNIKKKIKNQVLIVYYWKESL